MKIFFKLLFSFSFVITLPLLASEVLATVNGYDITQEEVNEFVVKSIPGATYKDLNKVQKKTVVNQMIERRLVLEDAKIIHIEKSAEYQQALEKVKDKLMLDFWMKQKVEEINITNEESKRYYLENSEKFIRPASVKVRHILVTTEEEAVAIISKLKNSKNLENDFIKLAKSESTGPSASNGGELAWFRYEEMVPEFSSSAFSIKVGTITTKPVKTQFGYHIIYLEDKKNKGLIPYEDIKPTIIKTLRLKRFKVKLEELYKSMIKKANITKNKSYLL